MKVEKQVSLKWAIALVLIACLVSSSIVYYAIAVSPSSAFTISGGVYPGAPSYTIWREGSYYFAKDANGEIDYSGTTAATVIQNAFNQNGSSYFFKAGTYELAGNTVVANAPVRIEGEGKKSIISGGTLKILGGSLALGWHDNNNLVRGLRFECAGNVNPLWLDGVVHGTVAENSFWKTSFYLANPQLRLTDCLTIRVRDNWFDGFNCQILRIDGTVEKPLHIISHNDFGSTSQGTFPTPSNPWEVAAIYIEGSAAVGTVIEDNLMYLNPRNIAVYSEAAQTIVKNNQIACAEYYGYFALTFKQDSNMVEGNYITVGDAGGGAIGVYYDDTTPMYYNTIRDNHISGAASTDPIYGVFFRSVIEGNIIYAQYGITLKNSGYNIISNNYVYGTGTPDRGFREAGASGNNMIIGFYSKQSYIYKNPTGGSTFNLCWNKTTWIP
jgi:parallel beta-helix repeat protein